MSQTSLTNPKLLNAAVVVAALGYFVDIYDLLLFSIVRIPSLESLGQNTLDNGIFLINMQMAGMLIGGILWGVLGDKKGRLSVLFGSIFLYSLANIANGMVQSIEAYAAWRFIAGIGLAGELGAGITLVAEILPKEKRGLGTMIVASVGLLGAVVAGILAKFFDWRVCYFIGGGLGMALLLLRIGVSESGMFKQAQDKNISKGNFFALFNNRARFVRYMRCIFIGLPTWFVVGVLVTFSPEFAKALGVEGTIIAGDAVMYAYIGLVVGDLASGLLSQLLKSRIKVMFIFLALSGLVSFIYLNAHDVSQTMIYILCFALGFSNGFWVIFVTIAAEQFGTNLRATVTTTVPNFVRGALVMITIMFETFRAQYGILTGAMIVGVICLSIAFFFLNGMKETFHEDLNYLEEI
jgi:MFS transporter, putative metabolite:H+ symporter